MPAGNAGLIEQSQMATAAAIDEMHRIKREPVPYTNDAVMPQLQKPYPVDSHPVLSRHCVKRHGDTLVSTSETADFARNSDSSVRWANFSIPSPDIFGEKPAAAAEPPAEPEAAPALTDREVGLLLTKHMEWNLQRNAYNPEIAAQMRCAPNPAPRAPLARASDGPDRPALRLAQDQRAEGGAGQGADHRG